MKKLIFFFLVLLSLNTRSQIDSEDFWSTKALQMNLELAKTPAQQIDALGLLSVHLKGVHQDSLGDVHFNKIVQIANNSADNNLIGRSYWWGMRYKKDTIAGKKFLQFATEHNQLTNQIMANNLLSDYYIHTNHFLSEKYVLNAIKLLDGWKKDTLYKDSVRIEVYRNAAHIYIHRKDGLNISRYMLALRDYAEQIKKEGLSIRAAYILADLYSEWEGQETISLTWLNKLRDYHKKNSQFNKLLEIDCWLALQHFNLQNETLAIQYLKETENLGDSLGAYGFYRFYMLQKKLQLGLITSLEFLQTLENHFNNHLFLHPSMLYEQRAWYHMNTTKNFDSVKFYIEKVKRTGDDATDLILAYYWYKKEFGKRIPILKKRERNAREGGLATDLESICKTLSNEYYLIKEYKLAYEYRKKANRLKDSLYELKKSEEVVTQRLQKEADIQQVTFNEQKKLQKAEQDRIAVQNKTRSIGLLSGVIVLLLIAGLLWRNNLRKQKDKLKIEQAYIELKSTQQQLIQSEKMASLGELTAGIAHEIQNPLNFVNNFSDVNKELLAEMKDEMDKGNLDDAKAIANDVIDNEEKINHHGKRADAIVKNMLQHSRSSSGAKEQTDINALADEYLRLSYHGLRAKDKSFNATMKTDFDENIGKINIIPQDIGRVVLNLINNAFYAVDEKKKLSGDGYEPNVSVSTKKEKDKIEIKVKDNGNGIPQKVLDKIFQPFFTTKPTGQGTGLGLSLSYDIVKAHGGELKVETKEGEGSIFIINLPVW